MGTYLVGTHKPEPGEPYNRQTQVLACGRGMVPAFWLSGFSSRHITEYRMSDFFLGECRVPWAVAETVVVKRLVAERYELLAKTFSQFGPHLEEWKKLVDGVEFKYIKIDMNALWSSNRKTYTSQIPAAIRWFESPEAAYFEQLLAIADMEYDPKRQAFTCGATDRVAAHHLRGYRMARAVPWPDLSWFREIWGP